MNNLKATKRESVTPGDTNKLRQKGLIPAILYGGKDPNAKISIDKKSVKNILDSDSFLAHEIRVAKINAQLLDGILPLLMCLRVHTYIKNPLYVCLTMHQICENTTIYIFLII